MDTGVTTSHLDLLGKGFCTMNVTTDVTDPFVDNNGHGTHVLGTIVGTGAADSRFRGVAPGIGASGQIRVAKVLDHNNNGSASWIEAGMDLMARSCGKRRPCWSTSAAA